MSDIGEDIKEVLDELGPAVSIYKYATATSYEEHVDLIYEVNQVYPWTSHFIMKALFVYDTQAEPGDLLTLTEEPVERFLIVSSTPERFEGASLSSESVIYKCNALAEIRRRTERREGYDMEIDWPINYSGEYCFFTGMMKSQFTEDGDQTISVLDRNEMYISDHIDVRIEDRCVIKQSMDDVSGEAYEVRQIERNRLPNIKICKVRQETRE